MVLDVDYFLEVAEPLSWHGAAQLANEHLRGLGHARVEGHGVDAAKDQSVSLHVVAAGRAERRLAHQQLIDEDAESPAVYCAVVTLLPSVKVWCWVKIYTLHIIRGSRGCRKRIRK